MNFEQYLQNKGLSEGVIKRYRAEMRRHRQFLHLLGKSPECATKKIFWTTSKVRNDQ